jgi:hypothetical protein
MRARLLALAALLLAALAPGACAPPELVLRAAPLRVGLYERFESTGALLRAPGNPFDPAQIDLRGEFLAPDGSRFELPGFVHQDFERALVGGYEHLTPSSPLLWRVRFTPGQAGRWRWRWTVTTPGGADASPWRTLLVADRPGRRAHGFLRQSPLDPRYLRFDDGTPYFALGENLSWYDGRGTFAYDVWLDRLAEQGATYVRLWMPSWAFGLEWLRREDGEIVENTLGDYTARMDRAWQLDRVLEAAEARGIQVMLCLQNHGAFSLTNNSEWADNPYNAANGGPLAHPVEFFTNQEARRLFERRLRYVVARWGASGNVLGWELWNEVDLVTNPDAPEVIAWHREMAAKLAALDPFDHLVTTSVSSTRSRTQLWGLPEIDLTQSHSYAYPFLFDTGFVLGLYAERARFPGKPLLIGEYGSDFRGPAETLRIDPAHIGFHDGLWVGALSGSFGTGMHWWWDNLVDPQDLYSHFGAVARFVAGVAFDEEGFVQDRPLAEAGERPLTAWALLGSRTALVWVKNLEHHYAPTNRPPGGSTGDPRPVEGASLALEGLADGAWLARWIDAYDGGEIAAEPVVVVGGAVSLAVPGFVGDVALRLERE